jgi:arginyl-tRNA synthetase
MRDHLNSLLRDALARLEESRGWTGLVSTNPQLERTRDPRHGDFTSNLAMRAAGQFGAKPRDFAAALVDCIAASPMVAKVEIAGPGFVNFTLTQAAYHDELKRLLAAGDEYGRTRSGAGRRVLVEYVSANPTGPLHVGHGRNAAYGASVANLLGAVGYDVDEEYYVNDAGRQMDILAASVWLRYTGLFGQSHPFPANAYQGAYVIDIAEGLRERHGDALLTDIDAVSPADGDEERALDALIAAIRSAIGDDGFRTCLDAALDGVLCDIKDDLGEFGIRPQRWFSERSLSDSGAIDDALSALTEKGLLYSKDGATWFRSTDYGDDKDRVVIRENGARTYFASDIAYHADKFRRGYEQLIDVLGSDHHGYVTRVRAGIEAMDRPPDALDVRLVQFVVLYRGSEKVQMSTRSGEYVTLRTLREEVGNDAARFFYVMRSNDQHLEFDLELAKSQSNDNPVYYVQYAHARVASMLRRMHEESTPMADPDSTDLDALSEPEEIALLALLSRWPEIVDLAAENRAPQHVVHYLREIASAFHSWYNAHRILVEDGQLRSARILLAVAAQQVIRNALTLLGVSAPESM